MVCLKTFNKLEEEIKDLSFSYDGKFISTSSEDSFVDIYPVVDRLPTHRIQCKNNTSKWHPKSYVLAYFGDEGKQDDS